MSDSRPPRFSDEPRAPREPSAATLALADLIDGAVRRVVTAVVVVGGLIALAVYAQDSAAPRYQVTAADGRIIRINTESGTVIACETEGGQCAIVLQRGRRLERRLPPRTAAQVEARPEVRPAPALPAPAPAAAANEAGGAD